MLHAAWDFEKKNLALVKGSVNGNLQKFRPFFEGFGVPVKIPADFGALFEGFQPLGATEATVGLKSAVIQRLDARIPALQLKR